MSRADRLSERQGCPFARAWWSGAARSWTTPGKLIDSHENRLLGALGADERKTLGDLLAKLAADLEG